MHEDRLVIVDDDREVVDFITAAADSQGLTCVGASDSHQFRSVYQSIDPALRTWGCETAQGFLFAPPMPGAELQALILDKNWTTREIKKSGMKDGQIGYKRTKRPPLPNVIVSA